jgi:ABC-type arginine/histidine transport system permease subunit
MGTATTIRVDTFRVYDTLIGAGIIYFVTVYVLTRALNLLEHKLNKDRQPMGGASPAAAKA